MITRYDCVYHSDDYEPMVVSDEGEWVKYDDYKQLQLEVGLVATRTSLFYMRDNHTFVRIKGKTISELGKAAMKAVEDDPHGYGSLCPAALMNGKKEIRSAGTMHHLRGKEDFLHNLKELTAWLAELEKDDEFMALLKEEE